jgi:hypothetical protein
MSDDCQMMMEREFGLPESFNPIQVGFYLKPVPDKAKSKEAGYPVFRDKEYFMKIVPGDKNSEYNQPATDIDRRQFPRAYAAFKNREITPIQEGFPIEQWPQLSRGEAMTLKSAAIFSVEALAAVNDGNIGKLGHKGREWRTQAQAFLAIAKDSAASQKLAAENQHLKDQMAAMQSQIDMLSKTAEKRGPGRPRKTEQVAA